MTWDELRAEAFGEIGLQPNDFYNMETDDYWLLHKGFFNKRVYDQRVFRRMVMTIISPWVQGSPSPYNIMPIAGDRELQNQIREAKKHEAKKVAFFSAETLARLKKIKDDEELAKRS